MNSQPPEDPFAIQSLVSAANRQITQDAAKAQRRVSPAQKRLGSVPWFKVGLSAVALAALIQQGGDIRRQLIGVPQATIRLEALSVLNAARAAVDQYRKTTGELPDRVPLAALDALVAFERTGDAYQVKLTLDGKTWEMDHNGKIIGGK
jgi:hypothetical protein